MSFPFTPPRYPPTSPTLRGPDSSPSHLSSLILCRLPLTGSDHLFCFFASPSTAAENVLSNAGPSPHLSHTHSAHSPLSPPPPPASLAPSHRAATEGGGRRRKRKGRRRGGFRCTAAALRGSHDLPVNELIFHPAWLRPPPLPRPPCLTHLPRPHPSC